MMICALCKKKFHCGLNDKQQCWCTYVSKKKIINKLNKCLCKKCLELQENFK